MNLLEQLRTMTTVVADTGEINEIRKYQPQDATTNPSLLLKAAQSNDYPELIEDAIAYGDEQASDAAGRIEATIDKLFVNFGREILSIIPGRVSTEVDARLSFDEEASVAKARHLIKLYESMGIERERVLIKLASTWEGMLAAKRLEPQGIHCNMTLMFELAQAVAADAAGATLISPFVGRIYDWYKKDQGVDDIPIADDPGVASVREIYTYLKHYESDVQVMGASFRKADQIVELAGCDLLTISPDLLQELADREGTLQRKLEPDAAQAQTVERVEPDEPTYRWMMSQNAMATDKLAEGIRRFAADLDKLREVIRKQVDQAVGA